MTWRPLKRARFFTLLAMGILTSGLAGLSWAQGPGSPDTATFFGQNCGGCHTIGGGFLIVPDLKNVAQKRDRAWLVAWLQNPKAVIDKRDPYALELLENAHGVVMPAVAGMTPALANSLLDLVDVQSNLPTAPPSGSPIPDRPLTTQDVAQGRALFRGAQRLKNEGPSCLSCHTMNAIARLGGGRFGPDLTLAYERLGRRSGLGRWLLAPASTTMRPIFRTRPLQADEIFVLSALLETSTTAGGSDDSSSRAGFFFLGLGGAGVGLVLLGGLFKHRFRGIPRTGAPSTVSAAKEMSRG